MQREMVWEGKGVGDMVGEDMGSWEGVVYVWGGDMKGGKRGRQGM